MRILLITDWNRGRGGAESYITGLREGLEREGDEVRLLTSSAGTAGDGHAHYVAFGTENLAAQAVLQIANPFAAATVRRAVLGFRPDVAVVNMFAHHLSPAALLPLDGTPSVLLVSDYKCLCPVGSKLLPDGTLCQELPGTVCWRKGCTGLLHWMRDLPRYALLRSRLGRFRRIVACSEWVRAALERHGVDAETLLFPSPAASTAYCRAPSPSPLLLYVGRLDREKGVEGLLRAFARASESFPDALLRLAGQGPLRSVLEGLASELGIADRVTFLGWLDTAAIERELTQAWSLVVPSLWAEPLGLVAVEAVVRGVPVIASEHGGLAEIIEHGISGLLFPNGDVATLEDRLRRILRGETFPGHHLPAPIIEDIRRRFDPTDHVRSLRRILIEATQGSHR
ncbi:MAG: glycosyltransferase family 4 protein [Verrucomicrobiota bacterium]